MYMYIYIYWYIWTLQPRSFARQCDPRSCSGLGLDWNSYLPTVVFLFDIDELETWSAIQCMIYIIHTTIRTTPWSMYLSTDQRASSFICLRLELSIRFFALKHKRLFSGFDRLDFSWNVSRHYFYSGQLPFHPLHAQLSGFGKSIL